MSIAVLSCCFRPTRVEMGNRDESFVDFEGPGSQCPACFLRWFYYTMMLYGVLHLNDETDST